MSPLPVPVVVKRNGSSIRGLAGDAVVDADGDNRRISVVSEIDRSEARVADDVGGSATKLE
jgi:hypothetical protein